MLPTPTDEIRAVRRELAAALDNDIHRIPEETRRRQRESGRIYISLPAGSPQSGRLSNKSLLLTTATLEALIE
jgi:hypothetical protein